MNNTTESDELEDAVRLEMALREYQGPDRDIHAPLKHEEILAEMANRPPFSAKMGLPDLDTCTDGFRLGQLIVVSGPPKNGKTLLCQNLTTRFTEQGHRCLWLEYELNYEEFLAKFPAGQLDFYIPRIMAGKSLEWIEHRILEAKLKYGTDVVFIDHLDFLRDDKKLRNDVSINLSSYVGGIVQKVKSIAVRHNLLIFLMSHIRKNEWTSGKLPSSEELRDSGQIAQLADIVIMVMRKRNEYKQYSDTDAVIGVIENRHNGKTRMVDVQLVDGAFRESTDPTLNQIRIPKSPQEDLL